MLISGKGVSKQRNTREDEMSAKEMCIRDRFTIDSIMSFTFFTTLSNVALDIVLVVFIVLDMILLVTGKDYKNNRLYMLKFLMTLSITLTCLVYMIILGPTSDDGLIGCLLYTS